jgi:hypothetical protein
LAVGNWQLARKEEKKKKRGNEETKKVRGQRAEDQADD